MDAKMKIREGAALIGEGHIELCGHEVSEIDGDPAWVAWKYMATMDMSVGPDAVVDGDEDGWRDAYMAAAGYTDIPIESLDRMEFLRSAMTWAKRKHNNLMDD